MNDNEKRTALTERFDSLVLELAPRDDAGNTVAELAARTGTSHRAVQRRLTVLIAQGRVAVGKRTTKDILDRSFRTTVYRLLKK